jgi:glycosyltransferase involved in cell wall biosynthesis
MTPIPIALWLLTFAVLSAAWFYYRRTKRLLNRSREIMQHTVDDAFLRIENRMVHALPEWKQKPDGKKVWSIIFTYDRRDMLQRTIMSLRQHEPSIPILAIDNGSTDGTCALLAGLLETGQIDKVLFNRHNDVPQWQKSFNINQALKLLSLESPDYIAWLDDDLAVTRPFAETAIELLEILKPEHVKVISMTDNELEESHHPTIKRIEVDLAHEKLEIKIRRTFNGQFNLFASSFFRELGPPPIGEGIRNFAGEDWYYSRRLQALDYRAAVFIAADHVGRERSKREEMERAMQT